jgi:hypothetical protein
VKGPKMQTRRGQATLMLSFLPSTFPMGLKTPPPQPPSAVALAVSQQGAELARSSELGG